MILLKVSVPSPLPFAKIWLHETGPPRNFPQQGASSIHPSVRMESFGSGSALNEGEENLIGVQNQNSAKRPFNSTFLSCAPCPLPF